MAERVTDTQYRVLEVCVHIINTLRFIRCVHVLRKWDVQGAAGLDWLATTHAIALCQRPYCTRLSVHQRAVSYARLMQKQ